MNTLLSGSSLWPAIVEASAVKGPKCVATAYVGPRALKKLGLGVGDSVHCALSIRNAKCGAVYPQDLIDLRKKGVRIFASESLHAKIYLFRNTAIVGSANSSSRSASLDEAALMTNDPSVLKAVRRWFGERQSADEVSDRFLEECQKAYRPPTWYALTNAAGSSRSRSGAKARSPTDGMRCWVLNNVNEDAEFGDEHDQAMDDVQEKAVESGAANSTRGLVSLSWPRNTDAGRNVRKGDWVLSILRRGTPSNRRYAVGPMEQCLALRQYTNKRGYSWTIMALKAAADVTVPFGRFSAAAKRAGLATFNRRSARIDNEEAVRILERIASSASIKRLVRRRGPAGT